MKTVTAGQMMHGQDDDAAADVAEAHVVRADTENLLGDANYVADRISLGSPLARTPHSPGDRSPAESSMTSKLFPTWRAYHQDFYASKWFRSIQIFNIVSVISVAFVIFVFGTDPGDLFDISGITYILLPLFLAPIPILLSIVVGGMRWSKVFQ